MVRLRYKARFDLWEVLFAGRFWVGPFATATGAATLQLRETYSAAQRHAWLTRK